MATSIPLPVKPFAVRADNDGVPLDQMGDLIGTERIIHIGNSGVPSAAASTRITGGGVSRNEHDLLILTARHLDGSDNSVVDKTWHINVDDYWTTVRSDEGDALTDASQTALVIDSTDGNDSMLIGRSNGGRMLVQLGGWSNPGNTATFMRLEALIHDAGLLARRLDSVTSSVSRVVTLQRRSATRPAAPTDTEVTYDGVALFIDENSEWVGLELTPTGPDPLWYTTTAFRSYSQGWEHDDWAVYASSTTFTPEYSTDNGNSWSSDIPDETPFLYRFRDADGILHGPYSEGTTQGGWTEIFNRNVSGDNPVAFALDPPLDWQYADLVAFQWENTVLDGSGSPQQGNTRSVIVPSNVVFTTALMTTGEQLHQILMRMSDHDGSGYSTGRGLVSPSLTDWLSGATQQDQRLRLDFQGASMGLQRAVRLVVRRGYTTYSGSLRILLL